MTGTDQPWFLIYLIYRRRLTEPELAAVQEAISQPPWHLLLAANVAPFSPTEFGGPRQPHGLVLAVMQRRSEQECLAIASELDRNPKVALLPTAGISISRLEGDDPLSVGPAWPG